jgi:hypothetical protein
VYLAEDLNNGSALGYLGYPQSVQRVPLSNHQGYDQNQAYQWSSVGATALYVATGFVNATTLHMVLCALLLGGPLVPELVSFVLPDLLGGKHF